MTSDQRNHLRQRQQQLHVWREHLCQLFRRSSLRRLHLSLLFLVVASTTSLLWVSSARVYANTDQYLVAQTQPVPGLQLCSLGGSGSANGSATSRTPFKVRLTGFLHTSTKQQTMLGLVTFDISSLNKSYLFALATLEAVDHPRISARKILRTIRKYENNFDVVGPSQLLSRIVNAEPGTSITLTGFLTLRNRKLQIVAVETQPYGAQNGLSTHPPKDQRYPALVLAILRTSSLNNSGVVPHRVRPHKQSRRDVQTKTSQFDIWTCECRVMDKGLSRLNRKKAYSWSERPIRKSVQNDCEVTDRINPLERDEQTTEVR